MYAPRSRTACDGCIVSPLMVIGSKVHLVRRRVDPNQMNSVFDGFRNRTIFFYKNESKKKNYFNSELLIIWEQTIQILQNCPAFFAQLFIQGVQGGSWDPPPKLCTRASKNLVMSLHCHYQKSLNRTRDAIKIIVDK